MESYILMFSLLKSTEKFLISFKRIVKKTLHSYWEDIDMHTSHDLETLSTVRIVLLKNSLNENSRLFVHIIFRDCHLFRWMTMYIFSPKLKGRHACSTLAYTRRRNFVRTEPLFMGPKQRKESANTYNPNFLGSATNFQWCCRHFI